jgi:ABC-type branched-subunit amino acid transport system substrate-binding protein
MMEAITQRQQAIKLTRKEARLARLQTSYDELLALAAANEKAGDHECLRIALRARIDAVVTARQIAYLTGKPADLTRDAQCIRAAAREYLRPF